MLQAMAVLDPKQLVSGQSSAARCSESDTPRTQAEFEAMLNRASQS